MEKMRKSFTLMEILLVVIIIAILAILGVANYRPAIVASNNRDAQNALRMVQTAEETVRGETNVYVACGSTAACNNALHLSLPVVANGWRYTVTRTAAPTFHATAAFAGPAAGEYANWTINNGDANPHQP